MSSRDEREEMLGRYELPGFAAGVVAGLASDAMADLRASAEALAAQVAVAYAALVGYWNARPEHDDIARDLFLGMQRIEQAADTTRRWQRADQERTGYPDKYRRG